MLIVSDSLRKRIVNDEEQQRDVAAKSGRYPSDSFVVFDRQYSHICIFTFAGAGCARKLKLGGNTCSGTGVEQCACGFISCEEHQSKGKASGAAAIVCPCR